MPLSTVRNLLVPIALLTASPTARAQYYPVDVTQQAFTAMTIASTSLTTSALLRDAASRVSVPSK